MWFDFNWCVQQTWMFVYIALVLLLFYAYILFICNQIEVVACLHTCILLIPHSVAFYEQKVMMMMVLMMIVATILMIVVIIMMLMIRIMTIHNK